MRKTFWPNLIFDVLDPKIALPDWNSRQYVKTVGFPWKLYKACFWGNTKDVLAKFSFFNVLNPKKRFTRLKFTPIREKCRLCIKIVENVLLRRSGGRFGQITFFNVLDPKIALPDWNSRQYVKTVGFPLKIVQNVLFRYCGGRFGQISFFNVFDQKSLHRTEIHANRWKL